MKSLKTILTTIAAGLLLSASALQAAEEIRISVPASMTDAMKELSIQFGTTFRHPGQADR